MSYESISSASRGLILSVMGPGDSACEQVRRRYVLLLQQLAVAAIPIDHQAGLELLGQPPGSKREAQQLLDRQFNSCWAFIKS
ncbi:MAG: hypothetical protein ACOX4Q_05945 [Syntrophomonadales bacterium]|jgi:hypothetical protein